MFKQSSKKATPVSKPFLTGNPTDENTLKSALSFFGIFLIMIFMTFIVCSMTGFDSVVLRILVNTVIILLILVIFYNNGLNRGTDAVARGEILWQRKEKNQPFSDSEKAICFHPAKGFLNGFLGSLPFILIAVLLAVQTEKQMTGYGTLPSWTQVYLRRSEIGDSLTAYTAVQGMNFTDVIRMIVRISMMPCISLAGAENTDIILWLERLSPVLLMLPCFSYGIGYLAGKNVRTQVHTEIAENAQKRARREAKARKAKQKAAVRREPEQLN